MQSRLRAGRRWFWGCLFLLLRCLCALNSRVGLFLLFGLGGDHCEERIEVDACLCGEPVQKRSTELLIRAVDRCVHKTAYTVRGRWFDATFFTVCIDRGNECLLLPLLRKFVFTEPFNYGLLILESSFMETKKLANSCTM